MADPLIVSQVVWEDAGCTLLARLLGHAAAAVTQVSLTGLKIWWYDLSSTTPETELNTSGTSLDKTAVIFDTLQTDDRWDVDDTGFNFAYAVTPATTILTAEHLYRAVVWFDPATGADFPAVFDLRAQSVLRGL
ncbi:MAG TPA: hypothetical protein VMY35_00615 [Phycisphaerae bacterium]|nr:hypothetical protein [Phycisphaerae bacterium]